MSESTPQEVTPPVVETPGSLLSSDPEKLDASPSSDAPEEPVVTSEKTPDKVEPEGVYVLDAKELGFDDDYVKSFSELAHTKGLKKEDATEVLKSYAEYYNKKSETARVAEKKMVYEDWPAQVKADKELGGEKYKENIAVAQKAYKELASEPLRELLDMSGLANHPEMVRLFWQLGNMSKNDSSVVTTTPSTPTKRPEDIFYGGGS